MDDWSDSHCYWNCRRFLCNQVGTCGGPRLAPCLTPVWPHQSVAQLISIITPALSSDVTGSSIPYSAVFFFLCGCLKTCWHNTAGVIRPAEVTGPVRDNLCAEWVNPAVLLSETWWHISPGSAAPSHYLYLFLHCFQKRLPCNMGCSISLTSNNPLTEVGLCIAGRRQTCLSLIWLNQLRLSVGLINECLAC